VTTKKAVDALGMQGFRDTQAPFALFLSVVSSFTITVVQHGYRLLVVHFVINGRAESGERQSIPREGSDERSNQSCEEIVMRSRTRGKKTNCRNIAS